MLTFVVTWDGNINVLRRRVDVRQGNDWDVDVRRLLDGLRVGSWVGNNNQSWLLERTCDVVGKVTWGESAGDRGSTSVGSKLQRSSLTEGSSGAYNDIGGVWDGGDDSSSQHNLLPGLGDVNDVDTVWSGLVDVSLVVNLELVYRRGRENGR